MALWASSRRLGLISRSGIIPIAHSQDTAGPMARTVRDAAILLERAGRRRSARQCDRRKHAERSRADYTRFLDPNGLRGARIGVARKYFGFSDCVDASHEQRDGRDEAARRGAGRSR